jgi:hypothetical protein
MGRFDAQEFDAQEGQYEGEEQLEQFRLQPAEYFRCQHRIVLPAERDSAISKARFE